MRVTVLWKREYREIAVDSLIEGMEIYDDVINRFGNVLVPAKTKVVDLIKIKNLLEQHDVRYIKVNVSEEEDQEDLDTIDLDEIEKKDDFSKIEEKLNEIKYKEKIKSFREDFRGNQVKLQKDFEGILKGEVIGKDKIKDNIDKTLAAFQGNINAFQLLEQMRDLDDTTYAHSQNVTVISYNIGKWLDLNEGKLQSLVTAALLADLGKMKVPKELLNKAGKLTYDETLECQKHVIESHELIKNYSFVTEDVKQAVLLHHERMDGSGYPLGLKGNKIPLLARIIAIADVYNALTSNRSYRKKMSPFEAIKTLETEYLDKLDSKILYIFLNRIGNCFIGQKVKLSDGQLAEIVYVAKQNIYKPVVKLQTSGELLDLGLPQNAGIYIIDFV